MTQPSIVAEVGVSDVISVGVASENNETKNHNIQYTSEININQWSFSWLFNLTEQMKSHSLIACLNGCVG